MRHGRGRPDHLLGRELLSSDGGRLGHVADVYIDPDTGAARWLVVRTGVLAARGRTIAFTDADLAYAPDQLRRVLAAVEDGWDVAIGVDDVVTVGVARSISHPRTFHPT